MLRALALLGESPVTDEKYKELFSGEKAEDALKVALDVRKFEIELYWKRATYFWAFIAATFIGYNAVQGSTDKNFLMYSLSSLGFVLSLAWVLANRGSKQWQENWEHHVDHLEDDFIGPLYKTTLPRRPPKGVLGWLNFITVGPSKHSVSKINQMVSLYVLGIWGVILYRVLPPGTVCEWTAVSQTVGAFTLLACIGLLFGTRTYTGPHGHTMNVRESHIE